MHDVTLTRHLVESQKAHPEATGEFTDLVERIALCGKIIANELRRSTLSGRTGYARTSNVYGEQQEKLDVLANEIFLTHLKYGAIVTLAASEEMDEPAVLAASREGGHYSVCFDPIDGSSNLDVNGTLGTIFGIRHRRTAGAPDDLLTSGREQVAAGYLLYGPATELVLAAGGAVSAFTFDLGTGEFFRSKENVRMPESGKAYAVNEGNAHFWKPGTRKFVEHLKTPDPKTKQTHATRYSASMVGDFHRILLQGGIYLYPEDEGSSKKAHGKLRVLYECHPLAYVAEAAGGRASTGAENVLDIVPDSFHARCPLAIGSREEVDLYEKFYAKG